MKNQRFSQKLEHKLGLPATILVGLALILLIDVVDYITDPLLDFSLFYLSPVVFCTWFRGRQLGIVTSGIAACSWLITESIAGATRPDYMLYYYWDSITRFGFYLVVALLLSSLRERLRKQKELARTDGVTGCANARHFREIIELEIQRFHRYQNPFALIYFDLDHFKQVNDTLGHHVGDEVLITVVKTAQETLRSTDLIARLGGDEFGILMPETSEEKADKAMLRLQSDLNKAMQEHKWPVTFSMGCISCIQAVPNAIQLIQIADHLMYEVKNNGKNGLKHMTFTEAKATFKNETMHSEAMPSDLFERV